MIQDTQKITYLGKSFETTNYSSSTLCTDELCDELRKEFKTLPKISLVKEQLKKVSEGGTRNNLITDYYFKPLMYNSRLSSSKWSVNEFMECNDLIRHAHAKVTTFPNFYPPKEPLIKNIKAVFRLGPSGTAASISNYPLKSVDDILNKYCKKNYYDFSCGWGVRLLSSLKNNKNYFGTDPNNELVSKLNEMTTDYKSVVSSSSEVNIKSQGSEIFIPEWVNKIDLAFSSPPYFDLEDYKIGEQSIKGRTYELWLKEYWQETVRNIIKYLKEDGLMMLNIKNIKKMNLLDDMKKICIKEGLYYHHSIELKNITRTILKNNNKHTNEEVLIFSKNGKYSEVEKVVTMDEW